MAADMVAVLLVLELTVAVVAAAVAQEAVVVVVLVQEALETKDTKAEITHRIHATQDLAVVAQVKQVLTAEE
jgi:hypothetical protein